MINLELNGVSYDLKSDWNDFSIGQYINILKLEDKYFEHYEDNGEIKRKLKESVSEDQYIIELISAITELDLKFLYNLYDEDLEKFVGLINELNKTQLVNENVDHFNIDGVDYSFSKIGKMKLGEKISFELLSKNSNSRFDTWMNLLSILVRPATKVDDKWVVEDFDGELDTILERKRILHNMKGSHAMFVVNSFMNGRV